MDYKFKAKNVPGTMYAIQEYIISPYSDEVDLHGYDGPNNVDVTRGGCNKKVLKNLLEYLGKIRVHHNNINKELEINMDPHVEKFSNSIGNCTKDIKKLWLNDGNHVRKYFKPTDDTKAVIVAPKEKRPRGCSHKLKDEKISKLERELKISNTRSDNLEIRNATLEIRNERNNRIIESHDEKFQLLQDRLDYSVEGNSNQKDVIGELTELNSDQAKEIEELKSDQAKEIEELKSDQAKEIEELNKEIISRPVVKTNNSTLPVIINIVSCIVLGYTYWGSYKYVIPSYEEVYTSILNKLELQRI